MIGIDQYEAWPRLSNAVSDAEGAARLFERLGFEPVTAPLLGRDATRDAMHRLVTGTLTQLTPDDSLVLFFAGHGHTQTTHAGDAAVKTGYVIPIDATQGHADAASTWLRLDAWLSDIARLPPRHILVIIDACHSGCALTAMHKWREETAWPTTQLEALWARRSRRVITSALDGQRALDSGPYTGHSLFTGCLIEALSGGLSRAGKRVTTGRELGQYLHRRVTTFPGSTQIPDVGAFELDDRGDILIPLLSRRPDERVPPGAAPNHARSPSVGPRRRASTVTPPQRERMPITDEDGTTHRLPAKSDRPAGSHRPGPGGLGHVAPAWRRARTHVRAVLTAAVEHLSVRGSRLTGGILLLVCLFAVASGIAVTFVDPFGWRGGQAQGSLIQEQPGRSPEARIVQLRGVDPVMPPTPPLPSGSYLGSNPGSGSAEVRVISTPPGAEVSLSGEPLGVTPLDAYIERRTGSEPLTIHHARYQDVMHAVDLSHDVEQTVVLVPLESGPQRTLGGAPPSGTILDTEIAADVDGAMVEIVGTDQRGPAPFTAKLEDGKPYKVRITARGFATEELDIKGGDPRQIAKPVPKPRFVVISSDPPGAQIFIDGTATRHVTPFQIELTAAQAAKKSVRVVLRKAGFRVLDRTIDMAKFTDGDTRMTAELDERLAPLPPVTRPPLGPPR